MCVASESEVGEYSGSVAGDGGSETLCTADSRKRRMGCRVREAGAEQENKESQGRAPDGKSFCRADGGDKGNHA